MIGNPHAVARAELGFAIVMLGAVVGLIVIAGHRIDAERLRLRDERLTSARYAAGLEERVAELEAQLEVAGRVNGRDQELDADADDQEPDA